MAATTQERTYKRLVQEFPAVGADRFTADGVYDKLAVLVLLAVCSGVAGALFLPSGIALLIGLVVALPLALVGMFKPALAKYCAPAYAIFEGLVLGVVSRVFSSFGGGIVPIAVIATGGVFIGCLAIFRTGLVRVTPRFVAYTMVATLAFAAVSIAAALGVPVPGFADLGTFGIIVGLVGLGIGIANLFIDFAYVQHMEQMGADRQGEWYGALGMMISLVLVYISILRILAASRR